VANKVFTCLKLSQRLSATIDGHHRREVSFWRPRKWQFFGRTMRSFRK